jgi:hypothetical protein
MNPCEPLELLMNILWVVVIAFVCVINNFVFFVFIFYFILWCYWEFELRASY